MEYLIYVRKKSLCAGGIGQIGFHPLDGGEELFSCCAVDGKDLEHMCLSIGASVGRANTDAHFYKAEQEMGADKTGSSGDQDHGLKKGNAFVLL